MNPARLRQAPNISIVGSTSALGKELKELLRESKFPTGKLTLLETEEYAGLLQEFAGDIQITQVISPAAFSEVDITFFACGPELMQAYTAAHLPYPEISIDLTGARSEGTPFLAGISAPEVLRSAKHIVNPHPAAIALARILTVLDRSMGVADASVTIMEPASERGTGAVVELQEQTVSLLNFQQVEHKVARDQIAFNLLVEASTSGRTEDVARRQLDVLLPKPLRAPRMMAVQAPVFHGCALSLFATFKEVASAERIRETLGRESGAFTVHAESDGAPSPVSVVGTDKIHVGRIVPDPLDARSCAVWLVADNLRLAASTAMETAEALVFAKP